MITVDEFPENDDVDRAVAKGSGGFVFADTISSSSIFAAPGPLPTAGTEPNWFVVGARVACGGEREGGLVVRGSGGTVFADTISCSSNFAAPGPLPAAGTEPTCFAVGAKVVCGKEREGLSTES